MTTPPFAPDSPEEAVWAAMLEIYAGAVVGDRARSDANIARDATLWDSDAMPLVHGLAELDAVRDARPARDSSEARPQASVNAVQPEIRIWDGTALLTHLFEWIGGDGAAPVHVRNTSVWRTDPATGRWLLAHNHEDVMSDPYWPVAE